jgi:hypothetical protein
MEIVNIIASGSAGNCEIYNKNIAVDMGVTFSKIKPYLFDLQIVLLSHRHFDHLHLTTIKILSEERPTLRFAAGEHFRSELIGIKNVDFCEVGKWYDYGNFKISPVKLYHDVPNFGWRIFIKQPNGEYYKIFRATDSAHLDGIEAKGYDCYCIEHNYNEDTIHDQIRAKQERGEFSHQIGSINSHLSEQQARSFIFANADPKKKTKIYRLHESNNQ